MKKIFLLLGVLALTGCGNDSQGNGYGVYQGSLSAPQGPCERQVVDAYNNFALQCNRLNANMRSDFEAQSCRFAAEHFVRNYPNMNCVALIDGGRQGRGWRYNDRFNTQFQGQQAIQITTAPMLQVLDMLQQFRGGNRGWYNGYQPWHQARWR